MSAIETIIDRVIDLANHPSDIALGPDVIKDMRRMAEKDRANGLLNRAKGFTDLANSEGKVILSARQAQKYIYS